MSYFHAKLKRQGMQALTTLQSMNANHKRIFTLSLAYVLSKDLALPVEEVEDIRSYFRMQHLSDINRKVSNINELLPHSIKQTVEDTVAFYTQRYDCMHPVQIPMFLEGCNAINVLFGINKSFSKEAIDAISASATEMTGLVLHLGNLHAEVNAAENYCTDRTGHEGEYEGPLNKYA